MEGQVTVTPSLRVQGARRHFGATHALEHVSFELQPGEWVGLVGSNGAGKTTLIRAVAGLETLDAGAIEFPAGGEGGAPHVGVVPQEIALYPLLTPRENLQIFGRLNGLKGATLRERVDWALAFTGLEDRADDRVGEFSGGMKRRLNIACSVLHRPGVVLLDEPTVGVDPPGRERIWRMLRSLCAEGAALIQSTHQLDEVQAVCDRILLMNAGRLVASVRAEGFAHGALGGARRLRLVLDRELDGQCDLGPGCRVEGRVVEGMMEDVSRELPALLARLAQCEVGVQDVRVESPRLEDVFAELTGWRRPA